MSSTAALLQRLLRISPEEAADRVAAARACGSRTGLTGEPLPVLLPVLAGAQADGVVSAEHTRVIVKAVHRLPAATGVEDRALAEKHLVEAAAILRPREVAAVGRRILAHLHPDGTLAAEAEQRRHRSFTLHPQADGSHTAHGRLTGACGALLLAALTPRSAPHSTGEAGPDPRSHAQRMHDALEDLAGVVVRWNEATESGAPAQVIITMTADQLATRDGLATTSFGQQLSIEQALRLADEAAINLLLTDATGAVLSHGPHQTHRHPHPNDGPDRPRPRLQLPRLRQTARVVPTTPHRGLGRRRHHRPGQPHPSSAATATANSTAPAGPAS
jgi:hypothetical protein